MTGKAELRLMLFRNYVIEINKIILKPAENINMKETEKMPII